MARQEEELKDLPYDDLYQEMLARLPEADQRTLAHFNRSFPHRLDRCDKKQSQIVQHRQAALPPSKWFDWFKIANKKTAYSVRQPSSALSTNLSKMT